MSLRNTYRAFRARWIEETGPEAAERASYGYEETHVLQKLRQKIEGFRAHLVYYGSRMLEREPDTEPVFRMALRIPDGIPLVPSRRAAFVQYTIGMLPVNLSVRRASALLRQVRTREGREFVFEHQVKRTLPGHNYFSQAFDFALRHFHPPRSYEELRDFPHVDIGWVVACYRLGVRHMGEVGKIVQASHGRISGSLALALVDMHVINSVEAMAKLPERRRWYSEPEPSAIDVSSFRKIAKILLDAEVAPEKITRIVHYDIDRFDPERLKKTLATLNLSGDELSELFDSAGEELLLVDTSRWALLRETLNVRSGREFGAFKTLLVSHRPLNADFVLALRELGADSRTLESCQALLLSVGDREGIAPPLQELKILTSSPYSLSVSQAIRAEIYLLAQRDLAAYLAVLAKHGYGEAASVIAFQHCYKSLSADVLDRWLDIVDQHRDNQPPEIIAEWVRQAGATGHIESFEYLAQVGQVPSIHALQQALKIAPLGSALLRYVVEVQGLRTLAAIRKWYFEEATGIKEVRLWGVLDEVDQVLLEDAFRRKDFTLLEGNRACVRSYVHEHLDDVLGRLYEAGESARAAYNADWERLRLQIRSDLAPKLKSILKETEGVILESLLASLDAHPGQFRRSVTDLPAILADLRSGKGPEAASLTKLEAEAIALVFRTTPHTVMSTWQKVIGRGDDLAHLVSTDSYPMSWAQICQRLRFPLDRRGLLSLSEASTFARQFGKHCRVDMHRACSHLSPKRLTDRAADVWSLSRHLGVLMAVAGGNSVVRDCIDWHFEDLGKLLEEGPEAYQHMEALSAFFHVNLGDALDERENDFIAGVTDRDASLLASKLDSRYRRDSLTAKDDLKHALALARTTVLNIYGKWAELQRGKFVADDAGGGRTQLKAIISKSPASFFAKEAARICTRANTAMWCEHRNSHLIVFSSGDKRIAGMALLYFESIPSIHPSKLTLVVRAINPMADVLARHSSASIVDGYFDVAQKIARANGFAAVAFPDPAGMHLMSNHKDIEDDIKERFINRAVRSGRWRDTAGVLERPRQVDAKFYAYEHGVTRVDRLFVIWYNDALSQERHNETEGTALV